MSSFNLRKKVRISYSETEEPNLDDYIFCTQCADYVYEYCSLHGPLLVVPDAKVPAVTDCSPYIPRAALTIPKDFLHLSYSTIPGAGLGVFSSVTLPADVRFGPFVGEITHDINSDYCWQIYDSNRRPRHAVDGERTERANWMRYVNCARHSVEQNLVAYQYNGQIYYRTLRIVPRHTELLVYYGREYAARLGVDVRRYNAPAHLRLLLHSSTSALVESQNNTNFAKLNDDRDAEIIEEPALINKSSDPISVDPIPTKKIKLIDSNTSLTVDFICDHCDEHFDLKSTLQQHVTTVHCITSKPNITDFGALRCSVCQYQSVTKGNLEKHSLLHDETRRFVCDVCNYRFKENNQLKKHLHVHSGVKPYMCNLCDQKFAHSRYLKLHMTTHTGDKPLACDVCEYKCARPYNLKLHMRTHTGDKPYACDVCEYKCGRLGTLKLHKFTHTGEKRYACDVCEYRCTRPADLKYHLMTHTGEKPFACNVCHYKFTRPSELNRHLKNVHADKK